MRLLTIPMSHYCEKARWALEYLDVPYTEIGRLQGFHYPAAFWHGGGPMVPVLIPDDGPAIADSTAILRHLDRGKDTLYPPDLPDIAALEERFDDVLGVETRRWLYLKSLTRPELLNYAAYSAPSWQLPVGRKVFALMRLFISRRLDVREQTVNAGLERIEAILAKVEARLSDGRRYLCGDRFTAADLSYACMVTPIVLPREYGIPLPDPSFLGDGAGLVHRTRDRPAGQFALRLFSEDRPSPPRLSDPIKP